MAVVNSKIPYERLEMNYFFAETTELKPSFVEQIGPFVSPRTASKLYVICYGQETIKGRYDFCFCFAF